MIGELKHRVTLYRKESIANRRGGFSFDYDKVGSMWASVMPLNQVEINKYREAHIETNTRIVIRYNPNEFKRPKAGDRIQRAFITFEIVGVVDSITNGDYLEILAVTI